MLGFPSFLRLNNIPLYVYTTFYLSIHPLWDPWLLPPFGYYKYGVGSIVVQVYVRVPAFTSFGYKPRSGIAGSCGNSTFNFPRSCHTVFNNGASLCSPTILSVFQPKFILCHSSPASSIHLHSPNSHPVYKVIVPVPLIRGKKKSSINS